MKLQTMNFINLNSQNFKYKIARYRDLKSLSRVFRFMMLDLGSINKKTREPLSFSQSIYLLKYVYRYSTLKEDI